MHYRLWSDVEEGVTELVFVASVSLVLHHFVDVGDDEWQGPQHNLKLVYIIQPIVSVISSNPKFWITYFSIFILVNGFDHFINLLVGYLTGKMHQNKSVKANILIFFSFRAWP